ncbi:MAG: alpha-ketoglutarate-dependent 2,4-dichlorophenoxyacetate dioxygenase [Gammaproteobacteria bacterium]|jgi:alpha-ketoglutarate-dependent 2,4-dichlorophenoxyacetate dioxygenase
MAIDVTRKHDTFFAQIGGVDLRRPLSGESWREIEAAFNGEAVLLFRDQPLTDQQQLAFSERFGPVFSATNYHWKKQQRRVHAKMADISNIGPGGELLAPKDERRLHALANRLWHTDNTFKHIPARCSLLLAREVPQQGGDTEFADMRAAYDALPQAKKTQIEDLVVEHSVSHSRKSMGIDVLTDGARNELPPVQQVLVRYNASSSRKALYIASHASHIVGWPQDKGRALLDELTAHATQSRFVYRHQWRAGDLILWDNRCTMHRATEYDDLHARRDMQRSTVSDEINSVERRAMERGKVSATCGVGT